METIGIIGFGNMGEAFAAGLRAKLPEVKLAVVEKLSPRSSIAKDRYGALDCTGDWGKFFSLAEVTILAVKPQDAESLLREISPYSRGKRFISIMAGKPIALLQKHLPTPYLCRFMPNLAAMYGKAAIGVAFPEGLPESQGLSEKQGIPKPQAQTLAGQEGISGSQGLDEQQGSAGVPSREMPPSKEEMDSFKAQCLQIAGAVGKPIQIPERLMPMMTGLSGSGIAFVFQFLHAMALGGVKTGFGYSAALETALQVVEGAVEVLRKTGEAPSAWITRVASPAGTTIEGLQVLEEGGFTASVMGAVEAASRRAEELEGV
jgi:pyrroline-5-carboxylate reductase